MVNLAESAQEISFDAQAGDIFVYEYRLTGTEDDRLEVMLGGVPAAGHEAGADEWRQGLVPVTEGGVQTVAFAAELSEAAVCEIRGAALLTGADAAAVQCSYEVICVDGDGNPVAGAMIQICNDSLCMVFPTDAEGRAEYVGAPYAYEVHVLMAPGGYASDSQTRILLVAGGTAEIILQKQ